VYIHKSYFSRCQIIANGIFELARSDWFSRSWAYMGRAPLKKCQVGRMVFPPQPRPYHRANASHLIHPSQKGSLWEPFHAKGRQKTPKRAKIATVSAVAGCRGLLDASNFGTREQNFATASRIWKQSSEVIIVTWQEIASDMAINIRALSEHCGRRSVEDVRATS
jgi:hypothetical protein